MGAELTDCKAVFNKPIPLLPTQMRTNNQTNLSMRMICVVSLTGINSFHAPLCISLGSFTAQRVINFSGLFNTKIR